MKGDAASVDNTVADRRWDAAIAVTLAPRFGATRVVDRRQRGPMALQRPFHPEGDTAHLYLLHPPGGVVGGDAIDIDVGCEQDAAALVTTPGATKFYRGNGFTASQRQCLAVAPRASLEWFPQENIFFDGAVVDLATDIRMAPGATSIAWEIHCFGRPAAGESFDTGRVRSRLRVFQSRQLLLNERFHLEPECGRGDGPVGLRGYTTAATLVAGPADEQLVAAVRTRLGEPGFPCGVTRLGPLLVLRCLGGAVEPVRELLIEAWRCLRPLLLDRAALAPRIWAT